MAQRYRSRRRNYRRAPTRKFVWARHVDQLPAGQGRDVGVDLLEQFQQDYGAQLIGSTVVRIRGYVMPFSGENFSGTATGINGIMVDSDNTDITPDATQNQPHNRPHEDWLAWMPWAFTHGDVSSPMQSLATANSAASPWAVDVRSSRKIEELGQGLYMFWQLAPTIGLTWNLSIGLKLP